MELIFEGYFVNHHIYTTHAKDQSISPKDLTNKVSGQKVSTFGKTIEREQATTAEPIATHHVDKESELPTTLPKIQSDTSHHIAVEKRLDQTERQAFP